MEDTPSSISCRGDDERKNERRSIKAKETVWMMCVNCETLLKFRVDSFFFNFWSLFLTTCTHLTGWSLLIAVNKFYKEKRERATSWSKTVLRASLKFQMIGNTQKLMIFSFNVHSYTHREMLQNCWSNESFNNRSSADDPWLSAVRKSMRYCLRFANAAISLSVDSTDN